MDTECIVQGVIYTQAPAVMDSKRPTCSGCAGLPNGKLCNALGDCMAVTDYPTIWIKKETS